MYTKLYYPIRIKRFTLSQKIEVDMALDMLWRVNEWRERERERERERGQTGQAFSFFEVYVKSERTNPICVTTYLNS